MLSFIGSCIRRMALAALGCSAYGGAVLAAAESALADSWHGSSTSLLISDDTVWLTFDGVAHRFRLWRLGSGVYLSEGSPLAAGSPAFAGTIDAAGQARFRRLARAASEDGIAMEAQEIAWRRLTGGTLELRLTRGERLCWFGGDEGPSVCGGVRQRVFMLRAARRRVSPADLDRPVAGDSGNRG